MISKYAMNEGFTDMIKRVAESDYKLYEEYVSNHPKGHFLQSLPWAKFKGEKKSTALLALNENGTPCGAMLIFINPAPICGTTLMYSPRGPVCDEEDIATMGELIDEAGRVAKENNAYMLILQKIHTSAAI
ncbi:MAG: peptidoglycan bridge formation glycyltransferase FemA/FemB family protein [Clostridia bacterium]